jgi:hypothetical protein
LEEGDLRVVRRLQAALQNEALGLSDLYGLDEAGAAMEHAIPHVAGAVIGDIGEQISLAHSILRFLLPVDLLRNVHRRIFHPDVAFLVDVRKASMRMTNAMPKIGKLWQLRNDLVRDEFASRFAAFGSIANSDSRIG